MRNHSKKLVAFAVLNVVVMVGVLHAGPVSGSDVLDRFLVAIGGREVVDSISSFHASGRYEITSAGLEGRIDIHFMRPASILFVVDLPGYGTIRRGSTNGISWSIDPRGGATIVEGDRLAGYRKWILRGFSLLPGSPGIVPAEAVETVEFEGRSCHKVKIRIPEISEEYVEYYDVESGLLAGRAETQAGPEGRLEMSGTVSGYRSFGDYLIPTRWAHQAGGQAWEAIYDRFEVNSVNPAVFELPEEIKLKLAGD